MSNVLLQEHDKLNNDELEADMIADCSRVFRKFSSLIRKVSANGDNITSPGNIIPGLFSLPALSTLNYSKCCVASLMTSLRIMLQWTRNVRIASSLGFYEVFISSRWTESDEANLDSDSLHKNTWG